MRTHACVLAAIGVAAAVMAPVAAIAATTVSFNGVSGTYGNDTPGPNTRLRDVITFSTPRTGYVSITWETLFGQLLTNIKAAVALNGVLLTGADTVTPTGLLKTRSLTKVLVSGGTQTITVTGSAQSRSTYSGTLSFAGVPEPAAWALMTLGFGGIAFGIRRRSRQTASGKIAFA